MLKALITDLDGTAVNISSDGSDIDRHTKEAVRNAINHGKKLTCATGREWELTKHVVRELGFLSPCIIEGGTRIINPQTEETIWEKSLDNGIPSKILGIFKSVTTDGLIMHSTNTNRQQLTHVNTVPSSLRFIYLLALPEDTAIAIAKRINISTYAVAHFTPSWEGEGLTDIHVVHPEATKEHAIQIWQELEGITKEETIGMGDSGNDVPIFLSSGYKVAVGNATPDLKKLADYIAPPVSEYALKHVIERILLRLPSPT
jgi:HAD superfamily hydrolase (TIGR01484 family)